MLVPDSADRLNMGQKLKQGKEDKSFFEQLLQETLDLTYAPENCLEPVAVATLERHGKVFKLNIANKVCEVPAQWAIFAKFKEFILSGRALDFRGPMPELEDLISMVTELRAPSYCVKIVPSKKMIKIFAQKLEG